MAVDLSKLTQNVSASLIGGLGGAAYLATHWKKHPVWGVILGYLGGSTVAGAAANIVNPSVSGTTKDNTADPSNPSGLAGL